MIDTSVKSLVKELEASEKFMASRLAGFQAQIDRLTGPFFRGEEAKEFDPESHEFELVAQLAPSIVFDNPRVRITTKLAESQQQVAKSIEAAVNRQIVEQNLRDPLLRSAIDALLRWGVLCTTIEEDGARGYVNPDQAEGDGFIPRRPRTRRISPRRFGWDPMAIDRSECRYYWHKWVQDKDTLRKRAETEEGWNLEVIEKIGSEGADTLARPSDAKLDRDEVVGYEIWVPDYQIEGEPGPDEGFNGTIFTLGYGQAGASEANYIREPRPFYGPPSGPYTVVGVYTVPDDTAPLAPGLAVKGVVDMLNAKVRARHEMELSYKKFGLVAAKDGAIAPKLKAIESGGIEVVNVDDVSKSVVEVELGGATDQIAASILDERARLAKYSGASDATRGTVTGAGTATENAIADNANETRIGFIKSQIGEAAKDVATKFAWYCYHDNRILFPLGAEAAGMEGLAQPGMELGVAQGEVQVSPPEVWYRGGEQGDGSGYTFADLELDIEPYSMERTSEALQQARFGAVMEFGTVGVPALVAQPYANVEDWVKLAANVYNMPGLNKLFDFKLVRLVQMLAMQGLAQPPQAEPTGKASSDVGAGAAKPPAGRPTLPARPNQPAQPFQGAQPKAKAKGPVGLVA